MLPLFEQVVMPFLVNLYDLLGYVGILLVATIDSACVSIPSEMVLPMSGWMVARGAFDFWLASLAATFGCLMGSMIAYWVGAYGGRPLLERYGKYVLISARDLDAADRWFAKYGDVTVLLARSLPFVRTYVSLPAGMARMPIGKYAVYSFVGSIPWCFGLTYAGKALGDNWEAAKQALSGFDSLISGVCAFVVFAFICFRIYTHYRQRARAKVPVIAVIKETDYPSVRPLE